MHTFYAELQMPAAGQSELLRRLTGLTRLTLTQIAAVRTEFGWVAWG